jgi:hypothetical protein
MDLYTMNPKYRQNSNIIQWEIHHLHSAEDNLEIAVPFSVQMRPRIIPSCEFV